MGHPGSTDLPVALRPAGGFVGPLFLCTSDGENPIHDMSPPSTAALGPAVSPALAQPLRLLQEGRTAL